MLATCSESAEDESCWEFKLSLSFGLKLSCTLSDSSNLNLLILRVVESFLSFGPRLMIVEESRKKLSRKPANSQKLSTIQKKTMKTEMTVTQTIELELDLFLKGATSRMAHLESSPFAIRLNLLHPKPSLFLFGLLSPLWCFPTLVNYCFEAFFSLKVILHFRKNDFKYYDIAPLNSA